MFIDDQVSEHWRPGDGCDEADNQPDRGRDTEGMQQGMVGQYENRTTDHRHQEANRRCPKCRVGLIGATQKKMLSAGKKQNVVNDAQDTGEYHKGGIDLIHRDRQPTENAQCHRQRNGRGQDDDQDRFQPSVGKQQTDGDHRQRQPTLILKIGVDVQPMHTGRCQYQQHDRCTDDHPTMMLHPADATSHRSCRPSLGLVGMGLGVNHGTVCYLSVSMVLQNAA